MAKGNSGSRNVYVDGSTRNNGMSGAKSGYGVHHASGKSSSGPVSGSQNSGRAEAAAVQQGMKSIAREVKSGSGASHCTILTDSNYAEGVANGRIDPGADRDVAQSINAHRENLSNQNVKVDVVHVSGHSSNAGNAAADSLARGASR